MALNHIGRVQEELKQYDLAEQALEQSLAIDPKQTPALQHWINIRQKSCAWPVYKPLPNISQNAMLIATSPLAMLALTDDPVQQLLTAFAFVERTYSFKEEFLSQGRQYNHARKRIGFVSGDLCVHAVGLLLAELIEGIDRTKHEVAKLKLADLFLDTFPYNCGSTTNDVVQAGVPIVTISGRTLVSRMGGSILQTTGKSGDLIANSYVDYKDKIKALSEEGSSLDYYPSRSNA